LRRKKKTEKYVFTTEILLSYLEKIKPQLTSAQKKLSCRF
jgi:hypothetical protein